MASIPSQREDTCDLTWCHGCDYGRRPVGAVAQFEFGAWHCHRHWEWFSDFGRGPEKRGVREPSGSGEEVR